VIEQKAFKIVHDAIFEVTGCKDLKSGDLYLSRVLVKAILALIALEQQPMVEKHCTAKERICPEESERRCNGCDNWQPKKPATHEGSARWWDETPADLKPAEPQAKTFKEQVEEILCDLHCGQYREKPCPIYNECPDILRLLGIILSAHNAELGRIAEGLPEEHITVNTFCDQFSYNQGALGQLCQAKAYIQAQKGS
jgi:hypothetical protein